MHEVTVATNAQQLRLIFHSLRCSKIADGDAATGIMTPIAPVDLLEPTSDAFPPAHDHVKEE